MRDVIKPEHGPPFDARAVANLLLDYADELDVKITQLALLKLIYFCHGWYLRFYDAPLVWNQFEAWERGPVVKVVRDNFKRFGSKPITSRAEIFDFRKGRSLVVCPVQTDREQVFIKRVFDEYRHHTAFQLSDLTHEIGSPWDKLWHSPTPVGRFALRITDKEIVDHFRVAVSRFELA